MPYTSPDRCPRCGGPLIKWRLEDDWHCFKCDWPFDA